MNRNKRHRIVILGGSFGGLTAAYELRHLLPHRQLDITIVSKDARFFFIPSLPWVTMGHKTLDEISFPLAKTLKSKGIECIIGEAERVNPQSQTVTVGDRDLEYDVLIIATGHRSANEAVPGLGPFDGPGHSLMSPREAEEAGQAWLRFLDSPGPIVIGCAPGASCLGPAYEFAFEVDHALKRQRRRHLVPITFVTPEPFLGHFGVGGMGRARQFFEGEFEHRDIRYHTSAAVTKITDLSVELAGGKVFESRYSMVIPPLGGVPAITRSPGLGNPKTGHMTVQMAKVAARNIVADISGNAREDRAPFVECILDMGNTAARIFADPVRPPRNRIEMGVGRRWLWAKQAYAPFFLWKMKTGRV